jgi:rod shape-determining protein MreC
VIGVHDTRRTRVILAVLLVAALALITVDYRDGSSGPLHSLRQAGGSVFGGVERGVSVVTSPVVGFFDRGSGANGPSPQVASLQKQVLRLRAQLSQEQLSKAEYRQLSRLLQLSGRGGYRIVAATVIAIGQGFGQTVTLDAGSRDGVRPQETVLDGQGLVGTVTEVNAQTCTVLLATDATSVVGVTLASSGQIGWVTGPGISRSGSGLLKLQVLDENAALSPGQQLVTSASVHDRPYVPGVPVGVISKVENRKGSLTALALVRPYVNFTALGVVGIVIAPPAHDPRFSVLPPMPKPRPTPQRSPGPNASATPTPTPSASLTAGPNQAAGG